MKNHEIRHFIVNINASIEVALERIEENKCGTVFAVNEQLDVLGVATDGDIRRALLNGAQLETPIAHVINREFVFAKKHASKEWLLKTLDQRIKAIPIISDVGRLQDVATRNSIPVFSSGRVGAKAKAPVRLSFAGGGSDLTAFFSEKKGATLSSTINLFCHASLELRSDQQISIVSADLSDRIVYPSIDAIGDPVGEWGLIQAIIKTVDPDFGFNLNVHCDFPYQSGLGGSSAVCAAVIGCFNEVFNRPWLRYDIANLAFQAERLVLGNDGGWQDQYATVFGGFNFMEFEFDQNLVQQIKLDTNVMLELEQRLILVDLGSKRVSGAIIQDQKKNLTQKSNQKDVEAMVAIAYQMKIALLKGRIDELGILMDEAWKLKRKLSFKITNDAIDEVYEKAQKAGAIGGKVLGAGGGGFMLFFAGASSKIKIIEQMAKDGFQVCPVIFDAFGTQSWKTDQFLEEKADEIF